MVTAQALPHPFSSFRKIKFESPIFQSRRIQRPVYCVILFLYMGAFEIVFATKPPLLLPLQPELPEVI